MGDNGLLNDIKGQLHGNPKIFLGKRPQAGEKAKCEKGYFKLR